MSVAEHIATAFTQKAIFDGLRQLRACRKQVDRSLWLAWSSASDQLSTLVKRADVTRRQLMAALRSAPP